MVLAQMGRCKTEFKGLGGTLPFLTVVKLSTVCSTSFVMCCTMWILHYIAKVSGSKRQRGKKSLAASKEKLELVWQKKERKE